jgi:pyrimidine-specific ribonucleoside hydrolase
VGLPRGRSLNVVLDVDTGVDDALALIFALRAGTAIRAGLRVSAVTCVAGNTGVEQVVTNTLTVLSAVGGSSIPVGRGAAVPLDGVARPPRLVHGSDGMGDLDLQGVRGTAGAADALTLLRSVLSSVAPVTVVALGPLTNLALLLRSWPGAAARIAHLVVSAGLPGPDPNLEYDPTAAAVVLAAVPRVTAYGPVFADVLVRRADAESLLGSTDPGARLAGRLVEHQLNRFGGDAATIGDAGAVAAVLAPDLLTTVPGRLCGFAVRLAWAVDAERARRLFLDTVAAGA